MRIAHVLRRLSFEDWGGTEQVVWNIAKAQLKAGHDVRIFATTALCQTPAEQVEGLDIRRFKPVYPWWPMTASLVADLDRKGGNPFVPGLGKALTEWQPDIIHCHAMGRIAELCLRTAVKCGARSVISLHGGSANIPAAEAKSLKAPTRGLFPWGRIVDSLLGWRRRIPEQADGIVCVGLDEYERYAKVHPNVMFLPNGVDVSLFASGAASQDATPSRESGFKVLCVARIDRQKNQMMLVEALARNPEMKVRLVGPVTQPDYLEELTRRAEAIGVQERFSYGGAHKPGSPELLAEYRQADAFALPSRHEPFGIVVLEAWAARLPVIASNVGGLGRLCAAHPGAALLFQPGDAASLDAALARLTKEKELALEMKEAGYKAASEYDWGVLVAALVDFYRRLQRVNAEKK